MHADNEDDCASYVFRWRCPTCWNWTILLRRTPIGLAAQATIRAVDGVIYPSSVTRQPAPAEVGQCDPALAQDYHEACAVLPVSPKASAALARRSLQHIIRSQFGITKNNLDQEITEVESQRLLTASLSAQLDAVRQLGNFAAHPMMSGTTGEVIDVEPAEAEWTLDVIEGLFEAVFVGPISAYRQMLELNTKLAVAGKTAMALPPVPNGFTP